MTAPRYLTQGEKALRPRFMTTEYRYWLRFQIRPTSPPIVRWFVNAEERAQYVKGLPSTAVIGEQGEQAT